MGRVIAGVLGATEFVAFSFNTAISEEFIAIAERQHTTLSVEKIPVVLRPVIRLPVKSMTSNGTRYFKNFINFDEKLVTN